MQEEKAAKANFFGTRMFSRAVGGLLILTLLAFAPLLKGDLGFVNADDGDYVTDNPHVCSGLNTPSILWAFSTFHAYNWHPLTWLSLELDYQLYQGKPWGFHFTNLVLHVCNVLLLFLILATMTSSLGPSTLVAALFAVHPLHVESVAWISERKDVLSTFFWFLTLAAYVAYARQPRFAPYVLVLVCFALGLLTKPMLVTLPFVLFLLDYWPLRRFMFSPSNDESPRFQKASVWRLVCEKLPLFALAAASSIMTVLAQQRIVKGFVEYPLLARFENAIVTYVRYMERTFWPAGLAIFYPHPRDTLPFWQVLGAALLLAGITAIALWKARRLPFLTVGWLWYLGTLFPVIGLVQVGNLANADRYTYVPLVGIFIPLVWGAAELCRRCRVPVWASFIAAAVVILACLACTRTQLAYWKTSVALWQHTVDVTEPNAISQKYLADALFDQGASAKALYHYRQALKLFPRYPDVHRQIAFILQDRGNIDAAVEHYISELKINPDSAETHYNLGRIFLQQGKFADAERHLRKAVELAPDFEEAQNDLNRLLRGLGSTS
jgi:hypothetical protein